ncbi:MAG: PA2779 family protein [Deltaproteobacteria bacterium]|jgi:hypothetical protein|nr:PA2779 family protein [Deltaproteobacteria bacterium]
MNELLTTKLGRRVVLLMLAISLALGLSPRFAVAGFAPTLNPQVSASAELEQIRVHLENKKVAQTLKNLGYTQEEITQRLAKLSPEEISQLAGELDKTLAPGGSAAGIAIGVVVVILVALGILSLVGKRVVVAD